VQLPFPLALETGVEADPEVVPPAFEIGAGPGPEFDPLALEAGAEPPVQADRMKTSMVRTDAKPVRVGENLRVIILIFP